MRILENIPLTILCLCILFGLSCGTARSQGDAKKDRDIATVILYGNKERSSYVGSRTCSTCHPENYTGWKTTQHSRMIQDPSQPGALVADIRNKDIPFKFNLEDVGLLLGSRFKQRFMKKIDDDYYILPIQWNVATKGWVKYFPKDEWWVSLYPEDWQRRPTSKLCDGCHSTGLIGTGSTIVEWNIACEACHGPGAQHVEEVMSGERDPEKLRARIVNPAKLPFERANDVCLQCHLGGRPPERSNFADRDYPVGYLPGDDLSKYRSPAPYPGREGHESHEFFKDGVSRKNRNQGNDFIMSRMYSRGVRCFSCHNPHSGKYTSMVYKPGNSLCLTCHGEGSPSGPFEKSLIEHTHHQPESAGSQCIECHMPKIGKNAVELESRCHCFDFEFVSPERSVLYGHPNACNRCHQDKTVEWALKALADWGGRMKWRWQRGLRELREYTLKEKGD